VTNQFLVDAKINPLLHPTFSDMYGVARLALQQDRQLLGDGADWLLRQAGSLSVQPEARLGAASRNGTPPKLSALERCAAANENSDEMTGRTSSSPNQQRPAQRCQARGSTVTRRRPSASITTRNKRQRFPLGPCNSRIARWVRHETPHSPVFPASRSGVYSFHETAIGTLIT
jgi:hypothetical protein